jgi:hypothetical protein
MAGYGNKKAPVAVLRQQESGAEFHKKAWKKMDALLFQNLILALLVSAAGVRSHRRRVAAWCSWATGARTLSTHAAHSATHTATSTAHSAGHRRPGHHLLEFFILVGCEDLFNLFIFLGLKERSFFSDLAELFAKLFNFSLIVRNHSGSECHLGFSQLPLSLLRDVWVCGFYSINSGDLIIGKFELFSHHNHHSCGVHCAHAHTTTHSCTSHTAWAARTSWASCRLSACGGLICGEGYACQQTGDNRNQQQCFYSFHTLLLKKTIVLFEKRFFPDISV